MSEGDATLLCLDLGWAPSTRSRTALARLTASGRIRVEPLPSSDDRERVERLAELLRPHALVLLLALVFDPPLPSPSDAWLRDRLRPE